MNEQKITAKSKNVRSIAFIAILVSLSVGLGILDKVISSVAFPFLPTAKIGLANIVVLYSLYKLKPLESIILVVIKSLLVGLLLGGPVTFVISITASLVSLFVMMISKYSLKDKVSCVGISLLGGITHITCQLLVVSLIYKLGSVVIYYGLGLVVVSFITSIIIGLVDNSIIKRDIN